MSIESFRPIEVPVEYKEVDLQDFNDTRIKMDGEFDIPRHLKDAFYMQLGSDVLEITRLLQGESGMQ
ncbi:MAG TPA: hypothetical protein VFX86_01090, partial [Candidatus Saccharimonadales bacterium]|nr:hypothetical protein [Candidatus Saccharimonadales bacterium]